MPTLSAKRQVTIPKELCNRLDVHPGDDLVFLEHNGRITIVKKVQGASDGALGHLEADGRVSEEDSPEGEICSEDGRAPVSRNLHI